MNHSQFLEVGIGLVFVFLLMAIMVSAANEFITTVISKRGKFLRDALNQALNDPGNKNYAELMYDHPLIDTLKYSQKRPPSYISSATFALALTEVIAAQAQKLETRVIGDTVTVKNVPLNLSPLQEFEAGLSTMKESDVKGKLTVFLKNSNGSYDLLKVQIENWFNEYMDRVSGWYRRKSKWRILGLSAAITLFMNVDTIDLSMNLWNNAVLRESVVSAAENFTKEGEGKADSTLEQQIEKIKQTYNRVGMLSLPIGWDKQSEQIQGLHHLFDKNRELIREQGRGAFSTWFRIQGARFAFYWEVILVYLSTVSPLKILGWIFTAFAVSFGAPYWFEFLKRLLSIRTMLKPKT